MKTFNNISQFKRLLERGDRLSIVNYKEAGPRSARVWIVVEVKSVGFLGKLEGTQNFHLWRFPQARDISIHGKGMSVYNRDVYGHHTVSHFIQFLGPAPETTLSVQDEALKAVLDNLILNESIATVVYTHDTFGAVEPTTGVVSLNGPACQAICEEMSGPDVIDIGWEDYQEEHRAKCTDKECIDEDHDNIGENYESCGPHLIGDWIKDEKDGLYGPNKEGSDGYAAIIREDVVQVVWSKRVVGVRAMCSPCYPGQADLDSGPGGILCFDLPVHFYDSGRQGGGTHAVNEQPEAPSESATEG